MHALDELSRHPGPAGKPQPMAFHEGTLWVGCWENGRLYAVDPATWSVRDAGAAPGTPYGIAAYDGALYVVVSIGEADDRHVYRYVPNVGFDATAAFECPEQTGSHLTSDGTSLFLVQQHYQRVVKLGRDGTIQGTFALPTRCAGIGFDAHGACSIITADDEFDVLHFAACSLQDTIAVETLAPINPEARGLAFDGSTWWTAYRELNEIVAFRLSPAATQAAR